MGKHEIASKYDTVRTNENKKKCCELMIFSVSTTKSGKEELMSYGVKVYFKPIVSFFCRSLHTKKKHHTWKVFSERSICIMRMLIIIP